MSTRSLSALDVIALRETYLIEHGYAVPPLRDVSLLESAVYRPQMAAYYEGADLIRQAALLGAGIVQNHPCQDGNKRGAYIAMVTFLDLNGVEVTLPAPGSLALAEQLEAIAIRRSEGMDLDQATGFLETWLHAHCHERREEV